jgi:Ca2+-binding EF-hand superfamily protein
MINHLGGNTGIKGNDLIKLTQMLCIEYPQEILNGILRMLDKKEEENVDFEEFLNAIKIIMLYDNYFEEMEVLFKYLDIKKVGKISKTDLVDAVAKLKASVDKNNSADGKTKCDLKVPNEDDIDTVYSTMNVEEEGMLNYDEYLTTLFKVTQEID